MARSGYLKVAFEPPPLPHTGLLHQLVKYCAMMRTAAITVQYKNNTHAPKGAPLF